MPNLTPNYNLKKPIKATENADIDVLNENMDKIDTQMKISADNITTLQKNIIIKQITLDTNNWNLINYGTDRTLVYAYEYKDNDINSNSVVDFNLNPRQIVNNEANSIFSANESFEGWVRLFASKDNKPPTITATVIIQKGV